LPEGLETSGLNLEVVFANGQIREIVKAFGVSHGLGFHAGLGLGNRHLSPSNHCSARILNNARNAAVNAGKSDGYGERTKKEYKQTTTQEKMHGRTPLPKKNSRVSFSLRENKYKKYRKTFETI
jgi:hypothetical protein